MSSHQQKKRSREEIIFAILIRCENPILKTELMEKANLSFKRLNEYLDFLQEKLLITQKNKHWKITEKGLKYIKAFEQLQNLLRTH